MVRQRQDILPTLPQRRHAQLHDVKPVIQILPEPTGFYFLFEIPVTRRNDPRVRMDFRVRAEALKPSVLRHAQQLRLKLRRHLANLIEKDRPPRRLLEAPDALRRRTRERPALVTEQLALQQRLGNGRAVHLHQRSGSTPAPGMDDIRENLLAHAALAREQDAALRGRHQRRVPKDGLQQRAARNDLRRQLLVLVELHRRRPRKSRRQANVCQQLIEIDRLREIVHRTITHRAHRIADVRVRRHQQHRQHRVLATRATQGLQTRNARHAHVRDHHRETLPPQRLQRAFSRRHGNRLEALALQE